MAGVLCSMVGASFTIAAAATVLRSKKAITVVGNAQISTAQSKFGGASLLLDGTGDYLTTDSASLAVGTGDFTFECWARASDTNAFMLFDQTTPTGSSNGYSIWFQNSTLNVYSGGWILQLGGTITTNTWHHIAVTRSGTSLRAFIDGTQVGSTITTSNNISQTLLFMGAARIDTSSYDGNGYMDEIRVSNNARYTANFTAPTAPFTNDENTLLLIHCNGFNTSTFFEDDNGIRSPKAIRRLGNGSISTAQSQFGGASLDLSGTTNTTALRGTYERDLSVGTGDFTIETWVRFTGSEPSGQFNQIFGQWANPYVSLFYVLGTIGSGSTQSMVLQLNNAVTSNTASTTGLFTTGVWYHIAVTRSSGTIRFFKDGTQITTTANSTNTQSLTGVSDFGIGYNVGADTQKLVGYLDELRVSNIARYTANFTAPTTAFTNDANTLLLMHMDGTNGSTVFTDDAGTQVFPPTEAFIDDGATKLLLHFNGTNGATSTTDDNASGRTAQTITMTTSSLSTTQVKFGTASLIVDGTGGDRVTCPDSDDWDLQAAPRTFECWVYINSLTNASRGSTGSAIPKLFGHGDQAGNTYWAFGPNEAGGLTLYYWSGSNNFINSTLTNLTTGVWYHVALITNAAGAKGYVNGVEYLSTTLSNTPTKGNTIFSIGSEFGQSMNAYIDEMRVSHVNRYT
ncbi:Concanavalin A-like lectin/glucanases superfamily [uncultured Caudovirales phage]|uniref:Concanavalin A-like lectin/glucanases superfamily n=1 Tax=uncultured Caudovirales phage TaxID=2100421 RepID=A0A6J7X5P3_9CAUD|nr:Concanavalin A-like lectin/glucanases superfamily [uncultured Caudovirales phage]